MKLLRENPLRLLAVLLSLLVGAAGPRAAAPPFQEPAPPAEEGTGDEGEEGEEVEDDEEAENEYFALVGGDVYTGTGGVLRGATVLAKNGKIVEIGYGLYIPEEAETLRVSGLRVYPGLVALNASTRISGGIFAAEEPQDDPDPHLGVDELVPGDGGLLGHLEIGEEHGDEAFGDGQGRVADDHIEAVDAFDPFSQYLVLALSAGITTAEQSGAALKLRRGEIDGVGMNEKARSTFTYTVKNPGSIRGLREKFDKAAAYLRKLRAWEKIRDKAEKKEKEPSKKGVDTSALRVLTGEVLAEFSANDREDLLGIARLAQRYGFRPVISGCREGWTVVDELGRAGAYAIVTPRTRDPKDERLVRPGGSSIENAAILHRHGVQVAVVPANTGFDLGGIAGRDLLHLPIEAGFAIRGGLPEQAALESITIVPARLLGVDHRVGTIEVGKDCDLVVTDGDILHYQTFVQYAVVAGDLVYDKQKEIFFAHIRPRPEEEVEEVEEVPEEQGDLGDEEGEGDEDPDEKDEDEGGD